MTNRQGAPVALPTRVADSQSTHHEPSGRYNLERILIVMATEIRLQMDDGLVAEMKRRLDAGEFRDTPELVAEAVRYYLERHTEKAWVEYVEKEVAWSRRHAGR